MLHREYVPVESRAWIEEASYSRGGLSREAHGLRRLSVKPFSIKQKDAKAAARRFARRILSLLRDEMMSSISMRSRKIRGTTVKWTRRPNAMHESPLR
jgi:hypothetical protein